MSATITNENVVQDIPYLHEVMAVTEKSSCGLRLK